MTCIDVNTQYLYVFNTHNKHAGIGGRGAGPSGALGWTEAENYLLTMLEAFAADALDALLDPQVRNTHIHSHITNIQNHKAIISNLKKS